MLKRLLIALICAMPTLAYAQSTTTLPTSTSYTPQFRYTSTAADTLKQIWVFSGNKYNRWYTATEANRIFTRGGGSFSTKIDSLKSANNTWTGTNNFSGNTSIFLPTLYGDGSGNGGIHFKNLDGSYSELYYGGNSGLNSGYLAYNGVYFYTPNVKTNVVDIIKGGGISYFKLDTLGLTDTRTGKKALFQGDVPSAGDIANQYPSKDTVRKYQQSSVYTPVLVDTTLTFDPYGNSFEVGADVLSNERWVVRVKNKFGFPTLIPNASGGTGILYAQRRQMINSPQTNNSRVTTLNMWFNQIGQQGRGTKTLNMGIYGLRAFIANHLLATAIPASDASISTTGTWSNYGGSDSSAMKATYIGGTSRQSFSSGATMTASFTGTNLVIGVSVGDGTRIKLDTLTAVVDGIYTQKFCGNDLINYAPQLASGVPTNTFLNYYHQATVLVFDQIGPGAHTVVITKGSNTSARIVIDYIGTMMSPTTAKPLIIGECPYFTPTGISTYNGLYGTQFTNGTVDTANVATIGVVKLFQGFPIAIAKVNTYFNLATDVVSDQIHPNALGHQHIANAYMSAMIPFSKSLSGYTNNAGFITSTPTGTGANYYGTVNINKDVSQGTGTNRYLILTKVSLGGSLVGNITGKRTKASSAGTNSANIYVNIRQNATTSTAYWESDAGTNATQPVLVTVTYDDGTGADTWYAIDAITTNTTSSLEKALFVGQAETTGVPFTWVPAASVTPIGTFLSNGAKNFGGRFGIGTTGLVNVNGLTASAAVATDASKNLVSVTNTGTGNNVLATAPTLTNPVVGTQTAGNNTTLAASTAFVTNAISTAGAGYVPTTRTISTTSPLTGGGDLSANRTFGLAGLTGLGSANQMLGMNAGATAYEYKTVTGGNNISITNAANSLTVASLIQTLRLTGSGTGAATTISIPHGLSGVTSASIVSVTPINVASTGSFYVTADATNINIIYAVAPVSGTNNLSYNVVIKP